MQTQAITKISTVNYRINRICYALFHFSQQGNKKTMIVYKITAPVNVVVWAYTKTSRTLMCMR